MKIKSLMTMALAMTAFVFSMSSCGSDDDEPVVAVADQVVGSYTGTEVLTVMGEADESTETFEFTKASDVSVDVTLPKYGEGMMTVPALPVKGIMLTQSGNTITGKLDKYEGTVKSADGSDKAYTVSDLTVIFSDKTVVVTFTQKYGNMPFAFEGQFTGTRK
jgi:lipopolysaccharide export system protein LptA